MERHSIASPDLPRILRMSRQSFEKLVLLLSDHLRVDESYADRRGGAISPDYRVFMTVRYLAGARYQDICEMCKVSKTAMYDAIERTIAAINIHPALGYKFPSTEKECAEVAAGFSSLSTNMAVNLLFT